MNFNSYLEDGLIIRPTASDFMIMELEELNRNDDNYFEGEVYEPSEKVEHTIIEINMIYNKSDIDKLRVFLEGKYVFEEGEILAAFDMIDGDRDFMIRLSYNYLKSLEDFDHVFSKWSLEDASIWALDILRYHISDLNAAEIFAVINIMLEDMSSNN
jgi:hypothetical protein